MDKLLVFVCGAVIGSFLNVLIYRLPKGRSIIVPGSYCPNCTASINWYDNIPILSYVILGGRARCCKARISFRYFAVELITAAAFLMLYLFFGACAKFFAYCLFVSALIAITFIDIETQEIPDEISVGCLIAGLALSAVFPPVIGESSWLGGFLGSFYGCLAGSISIYAMGVIGEFVFRKEAMGGGDVKLLAMVGSFLGWKMALLTFFLAPAFGSVAGIIVKIRNGKDIIPYGPYLSLGAVVSMLWGNKILHFLFYGML
jgi:leader peptidase (prepilin peptidase)/N-methyltransferase